MDKFDKPDVSTRLSNAFSPAYLDRLRERSEPPASGEATHFQARAALCF